MRAIANEGFRERACEAAASRHSLNASHRMLALEPRNESYASVTSSNEGSSAFQTDQALSNSPLNLTRGRPEARRAVARLMRRDA